MSTETSDRLPGMEDAKIEALESAAMEYVKIRDKRQKLTTKEVELKQDLLSLMHEHNRDHYEYNGVTVDVVVEEETVKVKIRKPKDDDDSE